MLCTKKIKEKGKERMGRKSVGLEKQGADSSIKQKEQSILNWGSKIQAKI